MTLPSMTLTLHLITTCLIRSSRHLISIFMTSLTPHYRGRGGGGELAPALCSTVPLFGCPFVRLSLCSAVPLFGLTLMTSLAPRPRPRACGSGIPLFSMTHLSGILLFALELSVIHYCHINRFMLQIIVTCTL